MRSGACGVSKVHVSAKTKTAASAPLDSHHVEYVIKSHTVPVCVLGCKYEYVYGCGHKGKKRFCAVQTIYWQAKMNGWLIRILMSVRHFCEIATTPYCRSVCHGHIQQNSYLHFSHTRNALTRNCVHIQSALLCRSPMVWLIKSHHPHRLCIRNRITIIIIRTNIAHHPFPHTPHTVLCVLNTCVHAHMLSSLLVGRFCGIFPTTWCY